MLLLGIELQNYNPMVAAEFLHKFLHAQSTDCEHSLEPLEDETPNLLVIRANTSHILQCRYLSNCLLLLFLLVLFALHKRADVVKPVCRFAV